MSLFLLIVAYICTGLNQVSNKALLEMGLGNYRDIYSIGFWGTGIIIGLIVLVKTHTRSNKNDISIGLIMGVAGAVAMLLLLAALDSIEAFIAFPIRSCGNVAITAVLSYFIWREKVSAAQWMGIGCAMLSIYLLLPAKA